MNDITGVFNTFVFPVALCIVLIWFLYKKIWIRIRRHVIQLLVMNFQSTRISLQTMN